LFEPLKFNKLNETDVREEVIAPLLRALGYRSGTDNNIIREQSLRYPRISLGRKNPLKDPPLRGKADYILEVQRAIRWVIEAKAPDVDMGADEIEQAWSYANHPEVRAVYFALCNGRQFVIFQTNQAPDNQPLLTILYEEFSNAFPRLQNVIGPDALLRDHPRRTVDSGDPIGPGLRSVARITNGVIRYERSSLAVPPLSELQIGIAAGAVERDEEERLIAYIQTVSPIRSMQALNDRLGLTGFEMVSPDRYLSVDPNRPTCFQYENRITIPAGEEMPNLHTWSTVVLSINLRCHTLAEASGILVDGVFRGSFCTNMHYIDLERQESLSGSFEAHLA
jgi:hypothetical protein